MSTNEVFLFYEGKDPNRYTPLTGVNLNKSTRYFKEKIDILEKDSEYLIGSVKILEKFNLQARSLTETLEIDTAGDYTAKDGQLYSLNATGSYNITLPTPTNDEVVRILTNQDGSTYTVKSHDGTTLYTSPDTQDDTLFFWDSENNTWHMISGDGIYLYLAVNALQNLDHDLNDFLTNRTQTATLDIVKAKVEENIGIITDLARKIRALEFSIGSNSLRSSELDNMMSIWSRLNQDEVLRGMGGSGLFNVRNYGDDTGFEPNYRPFDVSYSTMNIHNHPNYFNTLGMGEISAIVNGMFVRTTHNDPWMTYSVPDADGIDGTNEIPANEIGYKGAALPPKVPDHIKQRPLGITFNSTNNTTVYSMNEIVNGQSTLTQAEYFKNMFTNNEYLSSCRWDLSYLEVAIEEIGTGGRLFNYASSARHNQTGNTLQMLLTRAAYIAASGLKNISENDSFRAGIVPILKDDGSQTYAHVNYRLRVKTVGNPSRGTGSFGPNDDPPIVFIGETSGQLGLHPHFFDGKSYTMAGETWQALPLTREQANQCLTNPNTKITLKCSMDHNHSHLIDVWYDGSSWMCIDRNVVTSSGAIVTGHVHPTKISVPTNNLPFDLYKAVEGIIDNTNKFKLVRDISQIHRSDINGSWLNLATSNKARFRLGDGILEELCEKCYGFDGEGSFSEDEMNLPLSAKYNLRAKGTAAVLNASKYNRSYTLGMNDASNRGSSPRGFNDPTLFIAKTNATGITTGYTYMIPLELVLRTPLESWNPYNIELLRSRDSVEDDRYYQYTKENPGPRASYFGGYYMAPSGLYNAGASDAADTGGSVWMKAGDGKSVRVGDSGISLTKTLGNPSGQFVYKDTNGRDYSNVVRFRYPVYPVFHEYTYENVQMHNLKSILKSTLKKIVSGTITGKDIDSLF